MPKRAETSLSRLLLDLERAIDLGVKVVQIVEERRQSQVKMLTMDPYRVLGVESDMPLAEITRRYRELQKLVHPDRGGDPRLSQLVNWAYQDISRREKHGS